MMTYFDNSFCEVQRVQALRKCVFDDIRGAQVIKDTLKQVLARHMAGKADVEDVTVLVESLQWVAEALNETKARAFDLGRSIDNY